MKLSVRNYKRIVVKVGASLFYTDGAKAQKERFKQLASQVVALVKEGKEVVIVSSGAIALGMELTGQKARPKDLSGLQAAAAIGQIALMGNYRSVFEGLGLNTAQILLTWDDFDNRKRYLSAKETVLKLLKMKCVPVINENDTISADEIKFGDNDRLSALVATLINADLLIILSDVDGLLDEDKKVVKIVPEINSEVRKLACPTSKATCVGGMITKIDAAKIAVDSGVPCIIANGASVDILLKACGTKEADAQWTLFVAAQSQLASRERWIAFGTKPKGKILVDDGAKKALISKKSLLAVGVLGAEGNFSAGGIVSICDRLGKEFARGKAAIESSEINNARGKRYHKEILHRDNIVLL